MQVLTDTTLQSNCFALLDDAQTEGACSRLYTGLAQIVQCDSADTWPQFWNAAQLALDAGQFLLALLSYETGAQLQQITARVDLKSVPAPSKILIFSNCQNLSSTDVDIWLEEQSANQFAGTRALCADVSEQEFTQAIHKIQHYIAAGDTYQVNYTYRLHFEVYGSALNLYRALRTRQPVPYGALITLPDGSAILSLSPELFIRHEHGKLFAKPMKGTAAASDNETQNQAIALALKNDEKNRAENLMIVDLLRNDLGRIAQTGTVKVPQLFEVQRFSSVLQMTSNIEAQLRTNINLTEVMSALFPCGSITGAPKCRTMEIIREIEKADRGIYTGAIGWFDPQPDQGHLPDFCLSVPIRTMTLSAPDITGIQHGTMGVGAGIVFDSKAREEYEECQLKARFLTGLRPDFELFETMYATREDDCRDVDQHLMRLKKSAAYFEFTFDENAIRKQLQNTCINFAAATPHRLRLALKAHGEIAIQVGEIKPLPAVVKVLIAKEACHTPALFLRHKTSYRHQYDQAWQSAEREGAFDMLFCNAEGFITEGGRSSIFIRHGKTWLTPPLSDGVLPGIMRAKLLSDTQMNAQEKSFTIDELRTADEIILCNALRGAMRAELLAI